MAVSLELARHRVLAACAPLPTELVPVGDALGRVLAEPLIALTDLPPFANSAMDGYAVTAGPAPRTLRLVGDSRAGLPATTDVDQTTAIRISTGAALPPHAEAVVPDERAALADGRVDLLVDAPPGLNIRLAGEDVPAGRPLLDAGIRLGPVELAVAIGTGHAQLVCHRRPRVALIGTGNELREPGAQLQAGQIHDSNSTALAALATLAGATVVSRQRVPDDPHATRLALAAAFDSADLVILTGGVSVGPQDHVRAALAALPAEPHFSGVEIRPGRPAWFGTFAGVPVFALPGNPVAAIVIFALLGRPALAALDGSPHPPTPDHARLAGPANPSPHRTNVVAVQLLRDPDGLLEAAPAAHPLSAHATAALLAADALAIIPPGDAPLLPGTPVQIVRTQA
jgi:molybdopterin molybdotransferase